MLPDAHEIEALAASLDRAIAAFDTMTVGAGFKPARTSDTGDADDQVEFYRSVARLAYGDGLWR